VKKPHHQQQQELLKDLTLHGGSGYGSERVSVSTPAR
jgi:hypothetical protein